MIYNVDAEATPVLFQIITCFCFHIPYARACVQQVPYWILQMILYSSFYKNLRNAINSSFKASNMRCSSLQCHACGRVLVSAWPNLDTGSHPQQSKNFVATSKRRRNQCGRSPPVSRCQSNLPTAASVQPTSADTPATSIDGCSRTSQSSLIVTRRAALTGTAFAASCAASGLFLPPSAWADALSLPVSAPAPSGGQRRIKPSLAAAITRSVYDAVILQKVGSWHYPPLVVTLAHYTPLAAPSFICIVNLSLYVS